MDYVRQQAPMASGELSDLVQQFSELTYHSSEQQDDLAMELPH